MDLINNERWLEGYHLFEEGYGCPWGDESTLLGWLAAKAHAAKSVTAHTYTRPCPECDRQRREREQAWWIGLGCALPLPNDGRDEAGQRFDVV